MSTPEIFSKSHFCQAVSGTTPDKLRKKMVQEKVNPVDLAYQTVGRDMPRTEGDKFIDRFFIFMNSSFTGP